MVNCSCIENSSSLLTYYSDIQAKAVQWLWYPYFPFGKITLLQGDPGDGKSTMMMNIMAELSVGGILPDGTKIDHPQRIIYQCSEDGSSDTIKPRLENCGANCRNIAFIDEDIHTGLTLDDDRLRSAISEFRPKLVVIDPIQSYIDSDSDLRMATKARKLMRKIGIWASTYDCAFVLIGHLNKNESSKGLYRNLGSIDVVAAARSILLIDRDELDNDIRNVRQIKNNLAPIGETMKFEIKRDSGFRWFVNEEKRQEKTGNSQNLNSISIEDLPKNKHELACVVLRKLLKDGNLESTVIRKELAKYRIGEKTINEVKADMGIRSIRKMQKWYWSLSEESPAIAGKTIRELKGAD